MDLSHEERIAALLDGKCSDEERERLLAELVANDDDMEMLAAVAAALREYEEEERAGGAVPIHAPAAQAAPATPVGARWKPPRWVGLAAAAGLAALVVVPLLWPERRAEIPHQILVELSPPRSGIPAGFRTEPWGASRGSAAGAPSNGEKVQLGARLADLHLLAGKNDSAAREAASDVARLLGGGPSNLSARYDSMSVAGVPPGGPDRELGRRALVRGGEYAQLGAWLERARFAAASGDTSFFGSPLSHDVLAGRGPAKVLPRRNLDALQQVKQALDASPPKWEPVRTALDRLLVDLAR